MKNAFGDEIEEAGTAPAVNAFGDPVEAAPPADPSGGGFWRTYNKVGNTAIEYGMKPVAAVGSFLDRTTGAPIRAGISAAQDVAESDLDLPTWRQVPEGLAAFGKGALGQFGRDPSKAPTSKALFERAGLSGEAEAAEESADAYHPSYVPGFAMEAVRKGEGISPAGAAGFALDLATPVPGAGQVASFAKGAGKLGMQAAGAVAEGGAKVIDVATGTQAASKTLDAAKTVAEATGNIYERSKEGLGKMFKAKQADDFGESVKTALANGIDPKLLPEAVEFGPNSIVTRTAKVQAEGIAGQPILDKFHEGLDQVRGAVRRDVERLGGGAPLSKPEAGAVLREGFNQGVEKAFAGVNTSHRGVLEAAPELRLSQAAIADLAPKLGELETWAKAKAANGLTKTAQEQGNQILRAVEKLRGKGDSYAGAYEALQEIGEVAFKKAHITGADIPPDIARFRKLYGEISEAMIKTVDDAFGAGQGKALRESNQAMHKIFGDKSILGKIADNNLSDETLFASLIEQGDTKRIAALKEYLEPEQLAALKGAFLDGLIKADPEGKFPFRSLHNAIRQKNTVASALFEPGELDNLQALLKLGDKFGNAVMSTSGTGASNAIREGIKEIGNTAADAAVSQGIKNRARAVGFDIGEAGSKAAAKRPGPGPVMSLAPRFIREDLPKFNPRARAARAYSIYDEEDEEQ